MRRVLIPGFLTAFVLGVLTPLAAEGQVHSSEGKTTSRVDMRACPS